MRVRRRLRRLKRFAYLGAIVGIVVGVRRAKARRDAQPLVGSPASWPPLRVSEPPVAAVGELFANEPAAPVAAAPRDDPFPVDPEEPPIATAAAWVEPVVGACPVSHPIKANGSSRIYHVPGGRFYDRTQPERCYSDAAAAEADGYRAAKGS